MDHFLGKPTVQNLLGLRFANRVFEPLWHRTHIEQVDVVWDETVALEGRARYYDSAGALRDMIQNHLLQLLCLIAMEQPARLDERCLRDRKVEALRAVRRLSRDEVVALTVRGRYEAGRIAGRDIPDYVDEPGVDGSRSTETYAKTTFFVDNDRWHGVPFRLRTGKALGADRREIRIGFRPVAELPFGETGDPPCNRLTLQMDPDRMVLDIALNGAGDPFVLEPARLDSDFASQELSAYARLLVDVFAGDPVLSIRGDEAEECWRIVEPVLSAWETGAVPLVGYPAGSTGPGPPP
jgi:glucose-6-phosphate 1-dehydrogenase